MKMLSELELQGRVCRAIVDKQKAAHGEGSGAYATALNELAQLLQDQGKLDEAAPLMRQALAIFKKVHGEEHPNVANTLHNLALLLRNQDPDSAEAARLGKQALAIAEKTLDPDHPYLQEYRDDWGDDE